MFDDPIRLRSGFRFPPSTRPIVGKTNVIYTSNFGALAIRRFTETWRNIWNFTTQYKSFVGLILRRFSNRLGTSCAMGNLLITPIGQLKSAWLYISNGRMITFKHVLGFRYGSEQWLPHFVSWVMESGSGYGRGSSYIILFSTALVYYAGNGIRLTTVNRRMPGGCDLRQTDSRTPSGLRI